MQLNVGENIKKYRKEMNLTQEELADAFGLTVGAVSKWESGSTVPDIYTLADLADFFNVSMDVLLGYSISSKAVDDIVEKQNALVKEGRYDEAISEAEKALIRYPANFKIINRAAQTYYVASALGENEEQRKRTIELFETALKYLSQNTDPDESEFSIRMKIAELKSEESPEEALEEFRRINYMGVADINIAMVQMNTGKREEALDRYTRVLVSVLIRCIQLCGNLSIGLAQSGRKKDIREACELTDWGISLFSSTGNGKTSYLTKMQAVLWAIRGMCKAGLKEPEEMRRSMEEAYRIAREYDRDPSNSLQDRIRFWHGLEDYKPTMYDQLGPSAVEGIDALFREDERPLPKEVLAGVEQAKEYWEALKNLREDA
ncbi:MAG: helix-turn-helix domain-containing protein [Lachnospiraceae bacterium]|nr:helix-turn-helix domain-containing protein [Lachnospiraceae bacterium]